MLNLIVLRNYLKPITFIIIITNILIENYGSSKIW